MFDELRTVRRIRRSTLLESADGSALWYTRPERSRRVLGNGTSRSTFREHLKLMGQANFVNPGIFGRYSQFNRQYEKAILKGRAPGASKKDVEEGRERSKEVCLPVHID